jgi:hypothetical protein
MKKIPLLVVQISNDDKHAVSDANAKRWVDNLISELIEKKEERSVVKLSTGTMFAYLRIALKKGIIEKLLVSFDDFEFDCIDSNGKIRAYILPDHYQIFPENRETLMELL